MKVDPEILLKNARKLRKSQDNVKQKKSGSGDFKKLKVTLDEIGVSLKSHQHTIAKLQLEHMGLEQIEKSIDFLLSQNPTDFEDLKQAKNQIDTALKTALFQGNPLIPENVKQAVTSNLAKPDLLDKSKQMLRTRIDEITGLLTTEFNQINKIQISFENIMSLNLQSNSSVINTIDEIKEQLSVQEQIQSNVNPATVMGLLNS